jgi:16S rRNA (cytosine1402-N4)-methyltransferase
MGSAAISTPTHTPVLLAESIEALQPRPGGRFVDGTFGGGGHTRALLDASSPDGIVLAIDLDPEAIGRAIALQAGRRYAARLIVEHGSFVELADLAARHGLLPLHGILLDLGLSSYQLDTPQRGFSFGASGPLDMRFDTTSGQPASDLVNHLDQVELAGIIWRFGDEPKSRRIARAIVDRRKATPFETTAQLASTVEDAVGGRRGARIHPATRTFQALRIAVNDELTALADVLPAAAGALAPGGRMAVISFHSLEDRLVKQFLKRESASCICPPEQPVCTCNHTPRLRTICKAIRPGEDEVQANPRSRSAVLRVAERIAQGSGE